MFFDDLRAQHKPVLAMNGKRVEEQFMSVSLQKMYKHFYDFILLVRSHGFSMLFIDLHRFSEKPRWASISVSIGPRWAPMGLDRGLDGP